VASYPSEWEFDVVLRDGGVVQVRPVKPEDSDGLNGLFEASSTESRRQRFFRDRDALTPEELAYFSTVDYQRRMAFVALHEDDIIGVGRYDVLDDEPTSAEVAFLVADAHQGRGLAAQLLADLTAYARRHGVTAFKAFVLADNRAMLRVFRNSGYHLEREVHEGVYTVHFPTLESVESQAAMWETEKQAIAASLTPIFYPRSIAVIGASTTEGSIGARLFDNLGAANFVGPLYPVNPSATEVAGVPAYASVLDIPDPVDLAFIVVPARFVPQVVEQSAEKGVRGLVVISAGFSEVGGEGEKAEAELLDMVRSAGMRMVGPNCMGVLNTDPAVNLDGQFGPRFPPRGNVAMSSQSGALGIAILDYATQLNIGISTFVSVGNKADVSGNDLLLFWEDDPSTDVILLYLESFGNPRRFSRIARRVARRKPIVAVKSGRTSAGARAASSHTGSLASSDTAVNALFHQAGVVRTDTLEELFDVTALLANQPVPGGNRVAVLTNAGGPGILAADALEAQGLEVVELSAELRADLGRHLAGEASTRNPVDMIASAGADAYAACLDALADSAEVDSIIVIYIPAAPSGAEDVAAAIRDAAERHRGKKTFVAVFMSASGVPPELSGQSARVPTYLFPESAARALARAVRYGEWLARPEGSVATFDDVDVAQARGAIDSGLARLGPDGGWLEAAETEAVLRSFGMQPARADIAATADDAVAIGNAIEGPLVMKVQSESALHKSDIGGVVLGIEGEDEIRQAFETVSGVVDDASGVLVQEFVPGGHEIILGMTEDPSFGPLLLFGLGGVFVELIGDVAFRIHPLTDLDIEEMIAEVRSARLLEGYRGGQPGDVVALRQAMARLSQLIEELPEIVEMDLNPVKVLEPGQGLRVVDARIKVRRVEGPFVPSRKDLPAVVRR